METRNDLLESLNDARTQNLRVHVCSVQGHKIEVIEERSVNSPSELRRRRRLPGREGCDAKQVGANSKVFAGCEQRFCVAEPLTGENGAVGGTIDDPGAASALFDVKVESTNRWRGKNDVA